MEGDKTSPSPSDKSQLLLLGLQLLNKSLTLPRAVVKPQIREEESSSTGTPSPPASVMIGTRKRKLPVDINEETEKKEKRKMMNRVAAQNARDRKKSYLENLEKRVAQLEEENKRLSQENTSLKNQTVLLGAENKELQVELSQIKRGERMNERTHSSSDVLSSPTNFDDNNQCDFMSLLCSLDDTSTDWSSYQQGTTSQVTTTTFEGTTHCTDTFTDTFTDMVGTSPVWLESSPSCLTNDPHFSLPLTPNSINSSLTDSTDQFIEQFLQEFDSTVAAANVQPFIDVNELL